MKILLITLIGVLVGCSIMQSAEKEGALITCQKKHSFDTCFNILNK
jgi:hypothetical protein